MPCRSRVALQPTVHCGSPQDLTLQLFSLCSLCFVDANRHVNFQLSLQLMRNNRKENMTRNNESEQKNREEKRGRCDGKGKKIRFTLIRISPCFCLF